jgi:threonine 3-dehydrogenase
MTDRTMMAVAKTRRAPGYEYGEFPVPEPAPGQVLLRVERAAICGTDILLYKWDPLVHSLVDHMPFIPGHECAGEVVAVGPAVQGIAAGARVCAETHIACGACYQCTHGAPHICRNLILFGHQVDGCFAEYCVVPAGSVYVLQSDLPAELACMLEPFGVSLRGVQAVAPEGETLLVNGCGPIGLFAIAAARQAGSERIIATEVNPVRSALAAKMGADLVVDPAHSDLREAVLAETDGDGAGCIIEAAGAPGAVAACLSCLRKGGRLVVLGNPKAPVEIADVMRDFMHKEITLRTLHGRRMYETWRQAEALLAGGKVDIRPAVTHTFAMSGINDAMQTILSGEACKVALDPRA